MIYIFGIIFGLIQNIIGLVIYIYNIKRFHYKFKWAIVTLWDKPYSCSYGFFIFLNKEDAQILSHEYGHLIQSCVLGPFYLVLDLFSIIWYKIYVKKNLRSRGINYSDFFVEKWADFLGNKYTDILPKKD